MNDDTWFVLVGAGMGFTLGLLMAIILLNGQSKDFERDCLLEQTVVLNGTKFSCERTE